MLIRLGQLVENEQNLKIAYDFRIFEVTSGILTLPKFT